MCLGKSIDICWLLTKVNPRVLTKSNKFLDKQIRTRFRIQRDRNKNDEEVEFMEEEWKQDCYQGSDINARVNCCNANWLPVMKTNCELLWLWLQSSKRKLPQSYLCLSVITKKRSTSLPHLIVGLDNSASSAHRPEQNVQEKWRIQ